MFTAQVVEPRRVNRNVFWTDFHSCPAVFRQSDFCWIRTRFRNRRQWETAAFPSLLLKSPSSLSFFYSNLSHTVNRVKNLRKIFLWAYVLPHWSGSRENDVAPAHKCVPTSLRREWGHDSQPTCTDCGTRGKRLASSIYEKRRIKRAKARSILTKYRPACNTGTC